MTKEEAKTVFLNRGYVEVEGGTIYDPDKWREACVVISKWLEQEPRYCDRNICTKNEYNNIGCDECEVTKSQEPSGDLIQRQAVDTLVDELARAISDERCCISRGRSTATIMQDILDLPSVKPQPKMGHWIEGKYKDTCDKCRCTYPKNIGFKNYCPNCGTRMVEE